MVLTMIIHGEICIEDNEYDGDNNQECFNTFIENSSQFVEKYGMSQTSEGCGEEPNFVKLKQKSIYGDIEYKMKWLAYILKYFVVLGFECIGSIFSTFTGGHIGGIFTGTITILQNWETSEMKIIVVTVEDNDEMDVNIKKEVYLLEDLI